ncbi:MAG: flagellar biosynthesis anti-sigma factor FlgM [Tepidisphaerales bacterium]
MSSINGVNGSVPLNPPTASAVRSGGAAAAGSGGTLPRADTVELSGVNHFLSLLKSNDVRAEKVAAVKAAIEAGSYETPDKLDVAVDRLLDELSS